MKRQIGFSDLPLLKYYCHPREGRNPFIINRTFEVMRNFTTITVLLLFASCATRGIIPEAVAKGETIDLSVKQLGGAIVPIYFVVVQKNGEEYELIHTENTVRTIYILPANKLELLSEMETNLKELQPLNAKYFQLTISAGKKNKSYKINTDVVHDLITGLKKK